MRTTIDLPEKLVKKAMEVTHSRTKTGLIIFALENILRGEKIKGIKNYRGKLKLDINLDDLRRR